MIKFSIIIPLYNKEYFIRQTVLSVLNQTYKFFELLIIDDGSTDKSIDIIKQLKDSRIHIFFKENGGVSQTRNYGILKSSGNYICFLDADDLWEPTYLETLHEIIKSNTDVGFFCCAYKAFKTEPKNVVEEFNLKIENKEKCFRANFFRLSLKRRRIIALTSAVCIKKDLILSTNSYFMEDINLGEDADLWVRIALKTPIIFINLPLMLYRFHAPKGLTSTSIKSMRVFPYWNWYELKTSNPYKDKLTTLFIYGLSREFSKNMCYKQSIETLKHCRGKFFLMRRLLLYVYNFIKLKKLESCNV